MKPIHAEVQNFASYESLHFDFNKGLCLISGPTGAGKSTLCDVIPWILFGRTAKNGGVDEIRSWYSSSSTKGCLTLEAQGKKMSVIRQRGVQNDLYFILNEGPEIRGKDLIDTQRLLNEEIKLDLDTYLSGAYFHEFSQSAQFFTLPAKSRRQIIEQLVDLRLAKTLSQSIIEYKKEVRREKDDLIKAIGISDASIQIYTTTLEKSNALSKNWKIVQNKKIAEYEELSKTFEQDKARRISEIKRQHLEKRIELEQELADLQKEILPAQHFIDKKGELALLEQNFKEPRCSECGAPKDQDKRLLLSRSKYTLEREEAENTQKSIHFTRVSNSLHKHLLSLAPSIAAENTRENTHEELLKELYRETNPHINQMKELDEEISREKEQNRQLQSNLDSYILEYADLEVLQTLIEDFRAIIVKNTIVDLETQTNEILTSHFEAELRVRFEIAAADKLDVIITKDGNTCSYSQLSKGQRQLLKLSFALSVMQSIQNQHGVLFNTIFLDEFCEGLSETLKVKTYGLLQELSKSYENVFVVEHSQELKNLFDNKIEIDLINERSQIL